MNQIYGLNFVKKVDELSLMCSEDPELKEGLAFLDGEAYKLGISICDMVHNVLIKEA